MSDGELYHVIAEGIRLTGMPAWAHEQPETIWHIVSFVRHVPALTPEEVRELPSSASREEHEEADSQSR